MRMIFRIAAASACLVLASCDNSPTGTVNEANAQLPGPDAMQARLEALPEAQRNGVFIRAIRDADGRCQHVERSEPAGEQEGLPVWRAYCEDGASFSILIARGGSAQVIENPATIPKQEGGQGR
jgi:hypothetical protein